MLKNRELGATLAGVLAELNDGTLPKTFVFEGKDEASRHKAAVICSAALVCSAENGEKPCMVCDACRKAMAERHPDITLLSCSDGSVKVDAVRDVRADAFVSPFEAECKVFIFDGAQNLNVQSQNALLKILEEPPERVYFILTAPSSGMLLETVKSRCAKFRLGTLGADDIYRSVCEVAGGESEEAKRRLANAVSYIDGFEVNEKNTSRLMTALSLCDEYYKNGRFPYASLPSKKEDTETLKLIFKALAVCALEVCRAKKGAGEKGACGVLSKEALDSAVMRMPLRTAFSRYEFFGGILEWLEGNANLGAVIAALRSELTGV